MAQKTEVSPTVLDLLSAAADNATVRTVFGDPVTHDGVMIIPVARVGGGSGSGGGRGKGPSSPEAGRADASRPEGGGGGRGMGVGAKPAGVFVVKDGQVSWRPSVDVNRIVLGGQLVAVVALMTVKAVLKRWGR